MVNLKMIATEKELREETGLSHEGLWDAGFNEEVMYKNKYYYTVHHA